MDISYTFFFRSSFLPFFIIFIHLILLQIKALQSSVETQLPPVPDPMSQSYYKRTRNVTPIRDPIPPPVLFPESENESNRDEEEVLLPRWVIDDLRSKVHKRDAEIDKLNMWYRRVKADLEQQNKYHNELEDS